MQVLIRLGADPVLARAPAFDPSNQTGTAREKQFGYNNGLSSASIRCRGLAGRAIASCWSSNHEYANSNLMFAGLGTGAKRASRPRPEQGERWRWRP
jgi:hypothetical protein